VTSDDLHILDAICACAERRVFIGRPRNRRLQRALTRLRYRGLIAFDSCRPSDSARTAWRERHSNEISSAPASTGAGEPAGSERILSRISPAPAVPGEEVSETPAASPETVEAAGNGPAVAANIIPGAVGGEPEAFRARRRQDPKWTEAEDDRLRLAYAAGERIDLAAEEIGRTANAARSRAEKLGLSGSHTAGRGGWATEPDWTVEEERILRELYGTARPSEIASRLGRSKGAVYVRANQLGLRDRDPWTEQQQEGLSIAYRRGIAVADVATALGRKALSVSKYATNHGMHFGRRARRSAAWSLELLLALADDATPLPEVISHNLTRWNRRAEVTTSAGAWTVDRKERFLRALEERGTVGKALVAIGLSESTNQSYLRMRKIDPAFAGRCTTVILKIAERRRARAKTEVRVSSSPAGIAPTTRDIQRPDPIQWQPAPTPARPAAPKTAAVQSRTGAFGSFHFGGDGTPRPATRRKSDEEIAADSLRHQAEQQRMRALRPSMGPDEAKLVLQRRGFSVCRASTLGGEPGLWAVGTLTLTEREMIEKAARYAK
jgi:hypothetical protein